MTTLVVGASGATGKLLVGELLNRGARVRAVVRSSARLPNDLRKHPRLSLVEADLLSLSSDGLRDLVGDCAAIASCLGHNLTIRGIFGPPRTLVADATRRLCESILVSKRPQLVKFVLMNTAGNSNRDLVEPVSSGHHLLIGLIRLAVPPHADNEKAADFLRVSVGRDHPALQWVVVRPDTLVNAKAPSAYELHASPTRSALFNPGKTSRSNVAAFMSDLILTDAVWAEWRGRMPVIYNKE